jgi:hypothetical protein
VFAYLLPAPEMPSSWGAANDVVWVEALDVWPATTTVHAWFRPTPVTPKQLIQAWLTGSRVQLVAVRNKPSAAAQKTKGTGKQRGKASVATLERHEIRDARPV